MRLWSTGCSSGEEPYSIAIVLRESIPDIDVWDIKILATDISVRALEVAKRAVYGEDELRDVPAHLLQNYFTCVQFKRPYLYRVNEEVARMVKLARLDLTKDWPIKGPFDVIFCRNVMIYFDLPAKHRLIRRFWEILKTGGFLFVGLEESLANLSRDFKYVQPAVYMN